MTDHTRTAVVAGMAAGYLLGRTKKGKIALGIASVALGRRLRLSPGELLTDGLRKLGSSPHFGQLTEQLRDEVLGNGRTTLTGAVQRGCDLFAHTLSERTRELTGHGPGEGAKGTPSGGEAGESDQGRGDREQDRAEGGDGERAESEGEGRAQDQDREQAKDQGRSEGEGEDQDQGTQDTQAEGQDKDQDKDQDQGRGEDQGRSEGKGEDQDRSEGQEQGEPGREAERERSEERSSDHPHRRRRIRTAPRRQPREPLSPRRPRSGHAVHQSASAGSEREGGR